MMPDRLCPRALSWRRRQRRNDELYDPDARLKAIRTDAVSMYAFLCARKRSRLQKNGYKCKVKRRLNLINEMEKQMEENIDWKHQW